MCSCDKNPTSSFEAFSFRSFRIMILCLLNFFKCMHCIFGFAAEAILLGFQHYLVMLGTTVLIPSALVPQMGGGNVRRWSGEMKLCIWILVIYDSLFLQEEKAKVIQTLLFVAGLNTMLQTWFGTRLPAVMGGSYTFVAPTISIILSNRWNDPDPIMVCDLDHFAFSTQTCLILLANLCGSNCK